MDKAKEYIDHYKEHKNVEFLVTLSEKEQMDVLKKIYKILDDEEECKLLGEIVDAAGAYMYGTPEFYEFKGDVALRIDSDYAQHYWDMAAFMYECKYGKNYIGIAELEEKMADELGFINLYLPHAIDIRIANGQEYSYAVMNDYMAIHESYDVSKKEGYFSDYQDEYLHKAQRIFETLLQKEKYEVISRLQAMKARCLQYKEYENARDCLISELSLARTCYEEDELQNIYIYQEIALTYGATNQPEIAIEYDLVAEGLCKTRLAKCEKAETDTTGVLNLYCTVLDNLVSCYERTNNPGMIPEVEEKIKELEKKFKKAPF